MHIYIKYLYKLPPPHTHTYMYVYSFMLSYLSGLAPLEVLLLEAAQDDGDGARGVLAQELQHLHSVIDRS